MDTEKTMDGDGVKVYEIGYLLVSSIPEEKVAGQVEEIKVLLSKSGAEVIAEESPALRPLAYKMQKKIGATNHKFEQGYFGWIKFALDRGAINTIKVAFDTNESVLRYLLITTVRDNTYLGKAAPLIKEDVIGEKGVEGEIDPALAVASVPEVAPDTEVAK